MESAVVIESAGEGGSAVVISIDVHSVSNLEALGLVLPPMGLLVSLAALRIASVSELHGPAKVNSHRPSPCI